MINDVQKVISAFENLLVDFSVDICNDNRIQLPGIYLTSIRLIKFTIIFSFQILTNHKANYAIIQVPFAACCSACLLNSHLMISQDSRLPPGYCTINSVFHSCLWFFHMSLRYDRCSYKIQLKCSLKVGRLTIKSISNMIAKHAWI